MGCSLSNNGSVQPSLWAPLLSTCPPSAHQAVVVLPVVDQILHYGDHDQIFARVNSCIMGMQHTCNGCGHVMTCYMYYCTCWRTCDNHIDDQSAMFRLWALLPNGHFCTCDVIPLYIFVFLCNRMWWCWLVRSRSYWRCSVHSVGRCTGIHSSPLVGYVAHVAL